MKKLVIVLLFLIGITFSSNAQGLSLKLSKDSLLVNGSYIYSITIKIKGDKAPYMISLYNNRISAGGKLVAIKDNLVENTFKFDNLTIHSNYLVIVQPVNSSSGISKYIKL